MWLATPARLEEFVSMSTQLPASSSALPMAEPVPSALLKLLPLAIQACRAQAPEWVLIIAPSEAEAAGLDDTEVRALLEGRYIEEWTPPPCDLQLLGEARGIQREVQLAMTREGLVRFADVLASWGRAFCQPTAGNSCPKWVIHQGGGGELRLGRMTLKRVRHDSIGQRCVLAELERLGWPTWIPNPLQWVRGAHRKKALRDVVRRLNKGQKQLSVQFHVNDGGIRWEIII